MKWILLPQPVVDQFILDRKAIALFSTIMFDDLPEVFSLKYSQNQILIGKIVSLNEDAKLFLFWWNKILGPVRLDKSIVSIWCENERDNLTMFDGEDRAEIIDRILRLSHHIFNNIPFPDGWFGQKVSGCDSVYASERHLGNLRITYSLRKSNSFSIIEIGEFYHAKRESVLRKQKIGKSVSVPQIDVNWLNGIDEIQEPHEVVDRNIFDYTGDSDVNKSRDDSDILMGARSSGLHLFSLTYDQWIFAKGPLTNQQRKVLTHKIKKPLRIHGPAGSGKTLVLILKALYKLRQAADAGEMCHILFAVTSNAVEQTVRAAIESIDDKMFLATDRKDRQHLNVSTLHGWCIEELGLEQSSEYVLERDPKTSKAKQIEILNMVFEKVKEEKYSKVKNMLCADFVNRIENHKETLLKELQWEIGIRIKGRGFRIDDRDLYIKSPTKTFLGTKADIWDKHFIFHIYEKYENYFKEENLLDTDDVVLSMSARLSTSLWDRQRKELGYDYVFVDETHLFNDNERRVLPLLTRGKTSYPYLIMTFDEAQSIGGKRGDDLESVGIGRSERRNLKVVHRSSPDIFALARDIVERSPLAFTEFLSENSVSEMNKGDLKRCKKPVVHYTRKDEKAEEVLYKICDQNRKMGYARNGIIVFDPKRYNPISKELNKRFDSVYEIEERGAKLGALPKPGIYIMTPETCGGLEFDAVFIVGADKGIVPVPLGDVSREGYQSILEEAYMEIYTSVTRAKFVLVFISDEVRGISDILRASINSGFLDEEQ